MKAFAASEMNMDHYQGFGFRKVVNNARNEENNGFFAFRSSVFSAFNFQVSLVDFKDNC